MNAEGISKCIMEQLQIVLQGNKEKLITQTFDGPKVMEGKERRVQAKVKNVTEEHTINIAIVSRCS